MDRLLAALRQGQEKRDADLNKDAADAPDPTIVAARFHRGRLMLRDPALAQRLMASWAMASAFGTLVELAPFTPHALAAALQRRGVSALLGHLHLRLLRELLHRSNIIALREQQVIPPLEKGLTLTLTLALTLTLTLARSSRRSRRASSSSSSLPPRRSPRPTGPRRSARSAGEC